MARAGVAAVAASLRTASSPAARAADCAAWAGTEAIGGDDIEAYGGGGGGGGGSGAALP